MELLMNRFKISTFILLLCCPAFSALAADADCAANGDTQFICGPVSPEDLIEIPGTPWVIVSSMEEPGYLSVANTQNHTPATVFPAASASIALDSASYPDCPSPPSVQFQPHGVSLHSNRDGSFSLFVVAHGDRESVEAFTVKNTDSVPTLTWVGCAIAPSGIGLNSVAALADGGFVATNFNIAAGSLLEWQSDSGWTEVPGSQMPGPNGLVVSEDNRWFYIGGWAEKSVVRLSRGQTPVVKESVPLGFHVDNVRWANDGSLLAAGQFAEAIPAIVTCLNGANCAGVSTRVARISTDSMTSEALIDYPSDEHLLMGTVAIEVENEIWVGAIAGGTKIGRFPK